MGPPWVHSCVNCLTDPADTVLALRPDSHRRVSWDVGHLGEVDADPDGAYDPDGYAVEHARYNRRAGARYGNRRRAGRREPCWMVSPPRPWRSAFRWLRVLEPPP